jgi:hypothetical protein
LARAVEVQPILSPDHAVEMAIQRFGQNHRYSRDFEPIASAQEYHGYDQKLFRSSIVSRDARSEMRGKSPTQLSGSHEGQVRVIWLCPRYSLDWPARLQPVSVHYL